MRPGVPVRDGQDLMCPCSMWSTVKSTLSAWLCCDVSGVLVSASVGVKDSSPEAS